MPNLITIQETRIPVVQFQGNRVVTFAQIDQVHQRPKGTASRNFKKNRARFIENEDFYPIDYKSLDEFRPYGIFGKSARKGILITESGYMMLAKSFTDDLAWDVQRELVNNYFKIKQPSPLPHKKSVTISLDTIAKDERYLVSSNNGSLRLWPLGKDVLFLRREEIVNSIHTLAPGHRLITLELYKQLMALQKQIELMDQ